MWIRFLRSDAADIFRVTLTTGERFVGQISEYSDHPEDDAQEIVLSTYSKITETGELEDVLDAHGMLIPREAIVRIERTTYTADEIDGLPMIRRSLPPPRRHTRASGGAKDSA